MTILYIILLLICFVLLIRVPYLFLSVIVARQGKGDITVSNAIGSNILDILFELRIPVVIAIAICGRKIQTGGNLIFSSIILPGSVILLILLLLIRKWNIGRIVGIILLGFYVIYVAIEIIRI